MLWRRVPVLLIVLAALSAAWFVARSESGQRLEYAIADAGMRVLQHEIDSNVVIIGIDAKSLAELREWPWPRRYHAELLERLSPASPRQVFLDIDLSSSSNPTDDHRLESALASWDGDSIILPAFYQFRSPVESELILTQPLPAFRPHVSIASVNLRPSIDGRIRDVSDARVGNEPNLPSVASRLSTGSVPRDGDYPIDYSIDPASFNYLSYSDVVANRVPAVNFAEKIVFVGATAVELGDMVPVPVHHSLAGVTVQALAFESMRQGAHEPLPAALYWLLIAVWTVFLSFRFRRQSWRQNIVMVSIALACIVATALYSYAYLYTSLEVLPFAVSAVSSYMLITLQSLEVATLRAIAYAIGFRRRDALLKSIVLSSTDCIVCIDSAGVIKTANPAADKLFGFETGGLIGVSILKLVPSLLQDTEGDVHLSFDDLSNRVVEKDADENNGKTFPVEMSISRVRLHDEHLYTAIIRDISERKAQLQQLQFQATHDPLTTLPNRPALAAHLDSVLANHNKDEPVALMMIDLNRFKEVNDTLGHNVGDHVLYEVAHRLADVVRNNGFIARIGGDEFALIVDHFSDVSLISDLSRKLIDCLKAPIKTGGVSIDLGLSIGIALFPQDATDAETLFKQSDVAMYVAKRSRTGFEFYSQNDDEHSIRRLSIASRLRQAINQERLELLYQPQINLASGRVDSVEALLRWNDPELGAVSPDEFIALAEATDMILPLTEMTLVESFQQRVAWLREGVDLRLAINLSARMLQSVTFPARLSELMQDAGISADAIELEITESAMMVDPERALRVTRQLHELGVLISIDDYGTGYSSLAYLRDLPVHALKLDKSFVMNMQEHDDDRVIVESTVKMAHALKLKVVAEGVETAADATFLRKCGYDYAQGYLYSAALDHLALTAWVQEFNEHAQDRMALV